MDVKTDSADMKTSIDASVQPSLDSSSVGEPATSQRPTKDVRRAVWTIATGVALPCLPILAILTLLLSLIYCYKIDPWPGYPAFLLNVTAPKTHKTSLSDLRLNGGHAAYLVRYNPSTLTTIASWTSRIIPYLTSSIMALVTFFAARYIVQQSKRGDVAVLPNPEQLTLLIGLLGGSGLEPMKDTLLYRWFKKERLIHPLPAVFWVFFFITLLSILIPLVDTWFGIATHPVTITLLANTTTKQAFGRQLFREGDDAPCPTGPSTNTSDLWGIDTYWPCNVLLETGTPMMIAIKNASEVTSLQLGLPVSTTLSIHSVGSTHWIFYSDSKSDDSLDFNASTPAVSTQCFPMTQRCVHGSYNDYSDNFNCTSGFRINMTSPWPYTMSNETAPIDDPDPDLQAATLTGIAFSSDAELSSTPGLVQNASVGGFGGQNSTWPEIIPSNPTHFGTWARNYPGSKSISKLLSSDPEIFEDRVFNLYWFLNCTSTVANLTYTWVNGSILAFRTELMSPETAALFTGPFSLVGVDAEFEDVMTLTMSNIARKAELSDSMDQLAATWALEFSRNAMALAIGAFTPLQTALEQRRTESVTVARVPVGPLYLLVSLKLLYVVAVVVLAVGAYAFTHPAEIEVVKEQLSTKGLAASYFDQPQLLQHSAVKTTQGQLHMQNNKEGNGSRSGSAKSPSSSTEEPMIGISRVETLPRDLDGGKPRVGLAPDADGAWRFVMLANGVWHSIEPIVKTFAVNEAQQGKLGKASDFISTWK